MRIKTYIIKDNDKIYEYYNKRIFEKELSTIFIGCEHYESEMNISPLIEISLLNKKGQEFEKGFDSLKEARNFLNKVKRGNNLQVTSIFSYDRDILEEL